jgi:hypothetical protein
MGYFFLFATASRPALGPSQPPIHWRRGAYTSELKRSRREADHSPIPSAEFKNAWNYTSTPQYVLTAWCLVQHRDFTFYLTWRIRNPLQPTTHPPTYLPTYLPISNSCHVEVSSGDNPDSYSKGTEGKAVRASSCPLTYI